MAAEIKDRVTEKTILGHRPSKQMLKLKKYHAGFSFETCMITKIYIDVLFKNCYCCQQKVRLQSELKILLLKYFVRYFRTGVSLIFQISFRFL
jgi:hypothetical protein